MRPDCRGIRTSTLDRPLRNLYDVAGEEYEDLSLRAFAMVCEGQLALAEGLAGLAREEPGLFMKLGKVVMTVECEGLEDVRSSRSSAGIGRGSIVTFAVWMASATIT